MRHHQEQNRMSHDVIHSDLAPEAIGPYAQAVSVGPLTFLSGQIPLDPTTGIVVGEDDPGAQTDQVMRNLIAVLDAAGHPLVDLVKTTIYLRDMEHFGVVNTAYEAALDGHRPARATVEVARLPRDVLVEIDGIAVRAG